MDECICWLQWLKSLIRQTSVFGFYVPGFRGGKYRVDQKTRLFRRPLLKKNCPFLIGSSYTWIHYTPVRVDMNILVDNNAKQKLKVPTNLHAIWWYAVSFQLKGKLKPRFSCLDLLQGTNHKFFLLERYWVFWASIALGSVIIRVL